MSENRSVAVEEPRILSVSDLTNQAKRLLEQRFPRLLVEGEISNFARPSSGHWYFTLKDSNAQIRCAIFRNRNRLISFVPGNGMQVILRGTVTLYEARGDFQIIGEFMEQAGDGALRLAFDELKRKLAAEGLFDSEVKKDLPVLPEHLGVITSPSGAALKDVLTVLKRRFPAIPITLLPVQVQGADAAPQIVSAIRRANAFAEKPFDLLLLGRGGGSLEDLWPFNEELVARAIFGSKIPVVSAVGHETDFTIADFVADLRAPTPSAAAEMISPDRNEWQQIISRCSSRLTREVSSLLSGHGEKLSWLRRRMRDPGRSLEERAQRLDDLDLRIGNYITTMLDRLKSRTRLLHANLVSPEQRIVRQELELQNRTLRLRNRVKESLTANKQHLESLSQALHALNPLATLERGYAIVTVDDSSGTVVTNSQQVSKGDRVSARLRNGQLIATVLERKDNDA